MKMTASEILARARQREREQVKASRPVDYEALNKMIHRQRGALTRALNSGSKDKVVLACKAATEEWNTRAGMWPDDWSRWQRALDDTLGLYETVRLEDL